MARLITFGGLSVINGSVTNGAANPRSRLAILAVIAAAGPRGIRREKLLAMFWPDSDDARARNALRQAIFTMRRDLGVAEVTAGSAELRLDPAALTSDVADFDAAIEASRFGDAAAVYAGPFLDGVYVRESPEFERWAEEHRQRRSGEFARALEALAADSTRQGDRRGGAEWWRRRAVHDPLSGRVAKAYMKALSDAGDIEAAIRHANVHAALVRAELDAEPDPEVAILAEKLRGPRATHGHTAPMEPVAIPRVTLAPAELAVAADATPRAKPFLPRWAWTALATCCLVGALVALNAMHRPHRDVVLVTPFENQTGDSSSTLAGTVAASWISDGLAQTRLVDVVDLGVALERLAGPAHAAAPLELAHASGASTLVSGKLSRDEDSLRFDVRLIRVADGSVLQQLAPVRFSTASRSRAIEQLRQGVLGAFAAFGDNRFLPWANAASTPPTYAAYQEFAAGLDAIARGDTGAAHHFLKAAQLDTTFVQAKLEAVPDDGSEESYTLRDSLIRSVEGQRGRYTPFDAASVDEVVAMHRGDWESAYHAAERMVDLAPSSRRARLRLINDAMATMRYAQAVKEYHALDRNGWIRNWEFFWRGELSAHHHAGDYEGELSESRRARAQHPQSAGVCGLQLPALAALGNFDAVDAAIVQCGSLPGAPEPPYFAWLAGRELFAHGHYAASRRVLARALQREKARGREHTPHAANLAMFLGDWRPLLAQTGSRLAEDTTDFMTYAQHGVAAAHLGDTATARAMDARIASLRLRASRGQMELWRGFIAAALGERARAATLLREAVEHGVSPAFFFHFNAAYIEPLRGYPAFEELTHRS